MQIASFLGWNRAEIIRRCRIKVGARRAPQATDHELEHGIPLFVDQLIAALQLRMKNTGAGAGAALEYGSCLSRMGFTVAQAVYDYGDICQAVADLAIEHAAPISTEDFRDLSACLDDAIALAVTEFSRVHDLDVSREAARAGIEQIGILAHEVRNVATAVSLAFDALKSGRVGVAGSTAAALELSLGRLHQLVTQSLASVRLEAGNLHRERIEVSRLCEEIEITGCLSAQAKGIAFSVAVLTDPGVAVEADSQILSAVVTNLVQNAIKFTHPHGHVVLSARASAESVRIDIADECGGLPPGAAESLFQPYEQQHTDRSGLGLGLMIARRGAEAHGGNVGVRDVPGTGCIFTVEFPRARGTGSWVADDRNR